MNVRNARATQQMGMEASILHLEFLPAKIPTSLKDFEHRAIRRLDGLIRRKHKPFLVPSDAIYIAQLGGSGL